MIIAKSPMRFSLAGGGSDLPNFLRENGWGATVTTTLDKYVYVAIHESASDDFRLVYSEIENVKNVEDVRHNMMREVLKHFNISTKLEVFSIADLPSKGTGLGASSAFCCAMVAAVSRYLSLDLNNIEIATIASHIEMERVNSASGYQDQYASAVGGITHLSFDEKGLRESQPIFQADDEKHAIKWLDEHTVFLRVPGSRNSSDILSKTDYESETTANFQKQILGLVPEMIKALKDRDIERYANCMLENWELKKSVNKETSNLKVDSMYSDAINLGAMGGKLLGAGGSGFLAMVVPDLATKNRLVSGTNSSLQLRISGSQLNIKEI